MAGKREEASVEQNPSGATGQTGGSAQGSQVKEQAKQQGQQLAQQARQQASDLANRGGEQVKSQLDYQKHDASQRMVPIQTALRETAQQLRKQGQGPVAGYADGAAERVERFSEYLRETQVDEIADQARDFARRRPGLFLGSAALLGFLGTRFLKSSSEEASAGGYSDGGYGTGTSSAPGYHGTGEPATTLPPGGAAGSPTARRTPTAGRPVDGVDQPVPPRGI